MYRQFTDLDIRTREPVETKPEVFSWQPFIAWLEVQVARGLGDTEYCYLDAGQCLMGKYCAHMRVPYKVPAASAIGTMQERMEDVAVSTPRTYGAALTRALALQSAARSGKGVG